MNEVEVETDTTALLLIFPPFEDLCQRLRVPEDMRQGTGLLVALIPLKMKSSKYQELQSRKNSPPSLQLEDEDVVLLPDRILKGDPSYARALRILQFPKWLHDFVPKRAFCVWFAPVDGTQKSYGTEIKAGTETRALLTILNRNKAENAGYRKDVRIVFVHVGALKTLHKLTAFAERRVKRPELQFITYGSHPTVPINRWGIREIYLVGTCNIFAMNLTAHLLCY